jgi:N-acetylmuramoyl-L-alanine amidase
MRFGINIIPVLAVMLSGVKAYSQRGDSIKSDSLVSFYTKKMQKYLDKDGKVIAIVTPTKDGIGIYQPATDTSYRKLVYFESWVGPAILTRHFLSEILTRRHFAYVPDKPLKGYVIAIDPGHIGGDLENAKKEKKWVEMKNSTAPLIEGNLTLATAKILKKKLEEQGATVMLTRDKQGVSSFGITYEKWKDSLFLHSLDSAYIRKDISFEEKNYLLGKANDIDIFRRFFLQEDLRNRAKKINAILPDFTLIIHYNVDETNQNWNKPTKKNYNMAFVGGGFSSDEFDKPEVGMSCFRLLVSNDIERSIEFSKYIVEGLVQKTGVPAALDSCAIYLKGNCITTEAPGVFCRNLALTRMVWGTLCYGESLYQDNVNEYKALTKDEIVVEGMITSKRVEEVAEGYFEGIMNYVKNKKDK